ncbi:MAG: hypothetical protein IKK28_10600 [Mogibacterium sp.]|nr:hypothetical protein [Mogibacterium sp.]
MKKVLVVIVALILVLAFFGCSKDDTTSAEQDTETVETTETAGEEEEPSEEADSEADSGSDSGLLSPDFKKTMDDYEAWFDHYCDVMKKYEENPSDLELLSEMSDLLTEETKMLDEMENMDQSEMNTAELAYYLEVTARIEKKLLEVAY